MAGGMDDRLATHFAHLFIRDPIVIFAEDLKQLDLDKTDHFENLQSTNWQHMRFKPPPADNSIGWRVEFRPMEIQVTDFENAAFAVFIVLVTRAILSFDLNFYVPIAKVDENMQSAHKRDAVLENKFYFRKNVFPHRAATHHRVPGFGGVNSGISTPLSMSRPPTPTGPVEDEYRLMSINEIINGTAYAKATTVSASTSATNSDTLVEGVVDDDDDDATAFPGLIPLVEGYLDSVNVDIATRCELGTYLDLIKKRASGQLWTCARWLRHFVAVHPQYEKDSVVSEQITKDIVAAIVAVGEREQQAQGFRGLEVPGLSRLMGELVGRCGGLRS
jgi:glutamate--cysteine ligase catalytic subunit